MTRVEDYGPTGSRASASAISWPRRRGREKRDNITLNKQIDRATDIVVEQVVGQVASLVIEPLAEQAPAILDAILDAPVVEAAVGDTDEFHADFAALEDAEARLEMHGQDIQSVTSTFFADFSALNLTGGE